MGHPEERNFVRRAEVQGGGRCGSLRIRCGAAVAPAVVAARGKRLATKAQQGRRTHSIMRLQPAGRAAMKNGQSG